MYIHSTTDIPYLYIALFLKNEKPYFYEKDIFVVLLLTLQEKNLVYLETHK